LTNEHPTMDTYMSICSVTVNIALVYIYIEIHNTFHIDFNEKTQTFKHTALQIAF